MATTRNEIVLTISSSSPAASNARNKSLIEQKSCSAVVGVMGSFLDDQSLLSFSQTCSFFKRDLRESLFDRLLQCVAHGDPVQAEKIIQTYPHFLLHKGKVTDYTGRTIKGTAFQIALGAEDTQMAEMIKAQLIKIANEKEAGAQFNEQFPEGWKEAENAKWAPIFEQLETLTTAIKDAELGDIISSDYPDYTLTVREGSAVALALTQFKSMLDATLKETVTTGRHFNPNLLLRAFEIYDAHYEDYFGNYGTNPRAMAFWRQAVGYIERFMPANYVSAFCDGLYSTKEKLQKGTSQGRALKFEKYYVNRGWIPTNFYPLADSRLGFDFALLGASQRAMTCEARGMCGWGEQGLGHGGFRNLCQSKTAGLQNLLSTTTIAIRPQDRFA